MFDWILEISAFLFIFTIWWQWSSRNYWKKNNVPYIPGVPFLGVLKECFMLSKSSGELLVDLYNDPTTQNEPISGFYFLNKPGLLIRHPELIKRVLVKDFNNFSDRQAATDPKSDGIGANIMPFAKGEAWKNIRTSITPLFSGVKMKNFYVLLTEVCKVFEQKLANESSSGQVEYNTKSLFGRLTVDMISSCAFGVDANSLNDPDSEFYMHTIRMSDFSFRQTIVLFMSFFFPEIVKKLKLTVLPHEINEFLRNSINFVISERERSGKKRNDLIDALIAMRNNRPDVFRGDLLVAQAASFLAAGYDTSSTSSSFVLYELAKHPDLQEKLRCEIQEEIKKYGEVTYERINQLEYLNLVVQESIRMYPPLPFLDRLCVPTDGESYSLEPYHSFRIPKGMSVYIPSAGIHRDPNFYPDPLTFNPERFRDNAKDSLYLSFGLGPRGCIGGRLGMFQVKLSVISVLKDYRVECCESTPKVIKVSAKSLTLASLDPVNLVFKRL